MHRTSRSYPAQYAAEPSSSMAAASQQWRNGLSARCEVKPVVCLALARLAGWPGCAHDQRSTNPKGAGVARAAARPAQRMPARYWSSARQGRTPYRHCPIFPGGPLEERQGGSTALLHFATALARIIPFARSGDQALVQPRKTAYIAGKPTVIDREIAIAEAFLARPSPPPRRDASHNKAAVAVKYNLLGWWGHKAVVTRGGKWAQLAKVLTGDLTVDLFDHLREFDRGPHPSIEKVRGADFIVYRMRRRLSGIK